MHRLCPQRCTALLLALFLTLLLTGCGGEKWAEPSTTAAITAAGEFTQPPSSSALAETSVAETDALPSSTGIKTPETDSSHMIAGTSAIASTSSDQQEETQSISAQKTVSLAVTCHNAVAQGLHEWPGYGTVVPENGVIFSGNVALQEGDTVLEVLKRTLKEQKITLSEKRGYVRSINGLSEKLRGEESFPQSGWLYRVNGVFQSIGSNQYRLKAGDQIEWVYTCEPGDSELSR